MVASFGRYALAASVLAALLVGCGGSPSPTGMPNEVNSNRELPSHNKKFEYTGTAQSFSVPAGVTTITVNAIGAAGLGAFGSPCQPDCFGRGGRVYAKIPVKPGEKLYVYVGGRGTPTAGGFNGGGNPGNTYTWPGNGGGGASDVREGGDALKDRVLVAAGGGGQGGLASNPYPYYQCYGGNGGGKDGAHGGSVFGGGGAGGSQTQGGAGGAEGSGYGSGSPGQPGSGGALGRGGNGGTGAKASGSGNDGGAGGGGGGGYYGGGGGAGGASSIKGYYGAGPGGGGGGGSSWAERSAMHFRTWAGWKNATGNGSVVLTW